MPDAKTTEAVRRLVAELPAWLTTLLGADGLGAACGVRLLPTKAWSEPDLDRYPANTMRNRALEDADRAVRTGKVLVATGPSTPVREGYYSEDVQWHVDPAAPDQLWCALSPSYPGWLWVPVEPSADALAEVLRGIFPRPALRRVDFIRHERGYLGSCMSVQIPHVYGGDFVDFNGHDLDRYFTCVPFVEQGSWGSAHLDDPLDDDFRSTHTLGMVMAQNQAGAGQQMLGRVPSMSWRTRHSRSYLTFEIHTREDLCVRMSYRPAPESHQRVLAAVKRDFGIDYPADLPLDLAAALTGFNYRSAAEIMTWLGESDAAVAAILAGGAEVDDDAVLLLAARLAAAAAMWEGDLEKMAGLLLRYARHPLALIRQQTMAISDWYNLLFVLSEMALHSDADPDLQRSAEERLDYRLTDGYIADDTNVFGDHFADYSLFIDEHGNEHPDKHDTQE